MVKLSLVQKFAPEGGAGKVKNISTGLRVAGSGIGFTVVANTIDSLLLRGTMNAIGFNVPFLNIRMSLIDLGNYLAHNGGNVMPKSSKPFIALGAAKFTQGGLSLAGITPRTAIQGAGNAVSVEGASA